MIFAKYSICDIIFYDLKYLLEVKIIKSKMLYLFWRY